MSYMGSCIKRRSALWKGGVSVATKKGKGRKRTKTTQKRDTLRLLSYLASIISSLLKLAFSYGIDFTNS